jgi:hypothetical protein
MAPSVSSAIRSQKNKGIFTADDADLADGKRGLEASFQMALIRLIRVIRG